MLSWSWVLFLFVVVGIRSETAVDWEHLLEWTSSNRVQGRQLQGKFAKSLGEAMKMLAPPAEAGAAASPLAKLTEQLVSGSGAAAAESSGPMGLVNLAEQVLQSAGGQGGGAPVPGIQQLAEGKMGNSPPEEGKLEGYGSDGGHDGEYPEDLRGPVYVRGAMDKVCDKRGCKSLADVQPSLQHKESVQAVATASVRIADSLQNVHDRVMGGFATPGDRRQRFNDRVYSIENKLARYWDASLNPEGVVARMVGEGLA